MDFSSGVVIDRTFGSAELFGRTSTVRFGPNDRTFFCRTQNFFSRQPFILFETKVCIYHNQNKEKMAEYMKYNFIMLFNNMFSTI